MESPCKWYPLPSFSGLPALLVSARFSASSYTLHVTDLANIWVEKLDRKGILLRSLQENTSIDLVDADVQQWAVFLSKLQAALDPTSSDHHLTSLSIDPHAKNHADLTLGITCQLPKPLGVLRWPVHLVRCQPSTLASELTLPLIKEHYVRCREAEDLMTQLKEKDAVITKLLDKFSMMHTPLELIFNSLSAKHAISRAAAEEKIKGLAPFDESKWRSQWNSETPQNATALLQSVFGGSSGFSCVTDMDLGVSDTLNDWWTKLGPGLRVAGKSGGRTPQKPKDSVRHDTVTSGYVGDEDFQVQATPPHRSERPLPGEKSKEEGHETTESDVSDVSDGRSTRIQNKPRSRIGTIGRTRPPNQDNSASLSSQTIHANEDDTASEPEDELETVAPLGKPKKPNGRLGTIGGLRRSTPPTREAPVAEPVIETNDETASGSDSGSDHPARRPLSPVKAPTTPRKGTIGRIGGKSKVKRSPQILRKSSPDTADDDSASPKKTGVQKLGVIGKRSRIESKEARSEAVTKSDESETEEMKAERKRAELAQELNHQTTAPVKKKRKF
ncbi:XLF-domain-containing protein [Xylaria intraflava]|nr:XLF-domain-containing protein [Xylaria intraflava]